MIRKELKFFVLLIVAVTIMYACKKDKVQVVEEFDYARPSLPVTPYTYSDFSAPSYMQGGAYNFFNSTPSNNPVSDHGATLGRVLFYDKQLSSNNKIACANCHKQEYAFSDPEQLSEGLYGELTGRHSMAIINPFMGFRYFWDQRAVGLENQALLPIQHPVEMDMNLDTLVVKLSKLDYYPELFKNAFGDDLITSDRIAKALAQFMRSMYSVTSKFDDGMSNNFSNFTSEELLGKDLFFNTNRTNCSSCHNTYYFFNTSALCNGSESDYSLDEGLGGITGNPAHVGKFKVPTLRNIEYTAPYFHDGRFATLEDVINFYDHGIQSHPNLDDRLTADYTVGGPPRNMALTQEEVSALVAFLKTLSDQNFISNVRWSDPFN